jgi:arylsulfatase
MKTRREFLQQGSAATAGLLLSSQVAKASRLVNGETPSSRPNIVLMLADDMGFSDIGCYGSEIDTPNLNKLAAGGLRFKQFYNNPRCCPSRACLMTGLYPHQAGMGMMVVDYKRYPYPAYAGDLSNRCVTIAEALRAGGYRTAMAGKWHLTPPVGVDKHNWPLQRGFEKFFGTIVGGGSYFNPSTLTRDNTPIQAQRDENFYYTDAIGDHAVQFIDEFGRGKEPFFLYTAFTSTHWPLQAREEDIAKYKDRYRDGWDALRRERHQRQIKMGIVEEKWGITKRDPRVPPWELASHHEWESRRMAVFAAQLDRMDQNIGKIVAKLEQMGIADNTLIFFLADNGGNYEEFGVPATNANRPIWLPYETLDGRPVRVGNRPDVMPGPEDTWQSYGIPWGNCSNTPFRLYKHYAHEGGISTPLVAHWPKGIKQKNALTNEIGHETDIMATCLDVAGVPYPSTTVSGQAPPPLEGKSLKPIFEGGARDRGAIFWEHEGNAAMRDGKWKLVSRFPDYWELYDMDADRTEMHDLTDQYPQRVKAMAADYHKWAKYVGAQPWPMPETPQNVREGAMPSPPYLRHDMM